MNPGLRMVVILSLFPALGNFLGGLAAEWLRPSKAMLSRALHAAAGVIIAVIAVEVMPTALREAPAWLLALAFMAGGGAHLLLEAAIHRWQEPNPSGSGAGTWMVYVAVVTDLLGDGLLIGAGSAVSEKLAVLLALGQVLADVPEGFAVTAMFRGIGMGRKRRLLLSASLALPVVGAAVFSYFALSGRSEVLKMAILVFIAGIYTLAAVEDMLTEAHGSIEDTRWTAMSFLAGFGLFLLLATGVR